VQFSTISSVQNISTSLRKCARYSAEPAARSSCRALATTLSESVLLKVRLGPCATRIALSPLAPKCLRYKLQSTPLPAYGDDEITSIPLVVASVGLTAVSISTSALLECSSV